MPIFLPISGVDLGSVVAGFFQLRLGFQTDYGVSGTAMASIIYTFQGKTSHAGGAPWGGRSALDAVEIMNVATNYLREHLHFSARMHYVIPDGGEAPNVVPDRARV